jgi:hypothetical protein
MGSYSDYEHHLADLSPMATNHHNLTFSHSFINQDSHNPRLFKTKYPVLRLAVITLKGVGGNDLIRTQIFTGLRHPHYFTKRNLETPYEQSTVLNINKITMVND